MQLNSVYLYPNKIDVYTNTLASWTTERYRRVYNRNLKIYRSVDNRIDLQVRNADQKAAAITNTTLVFNIITREGKDLLLSKDCVIQSNANGRAFVTLTAAEMIDIQEGLYNYSITQEVREARDNDEYVVTSRTPLYQDSQYGVVATIEVAGDALGQTEESLELRDFSFTDPANTGDQDPPFYISSLINVKSHVSTANSVRTLQFYHAGDFTGRITIQGSLDNSSDPSNWVDIPHDSVTPGGNTFATDGDEVTYRNITGKYNWLRVKIGASFNGSAKFVIGNRMDQTYDVAVYSGGKSYVVGQQLIITGDKLMGGAGVNDLTITVASVNYQGSITGVTHTGVSVAETRSYVLGATGSPTFGTVDKILFR